MKEGYNLKVGSKKRIQFALLLIFNFLLLNCFFAQQKQIDSLLQVLKTSANDTNKVNVLNLLSNKIARSGNFNAATAYAASADSLAKQLNYPEGIAKANINLGNISMDKGDFNKSLLHYIQSYKISQGNSYKNMANAVKNIGIIYYYLGDLDKSRDFYAKALKLFELINDKEGMASCLGNIGLIYNYQGNYPNALQYYLKALKLQELTGNKNGISNVNIYIGSIYIGMKDYKNALPYLLKASQIADDAGLKKVASSAYNNIGIVYDDTGDLPKAMEYFKKSNNLSKEINDIRGNASTLANIGIVYRRQGEYNKAIDCFLKALAMEEELDNKSGIVVSCLGLSDTYSSLKNYAKAEAYIKRGLALSKETGHLDGVKNCSKTYSLIFEETGRHKEALQLYKEYINARDSLVNEENTKKTVQTQMQYEFDKKEAATAAENSRREAVAAAESRKQRIILFAISGFGLLLLVLAGVIFRSLRINQKKNRIISLQKEAVEKQKAIVEEHQKEILDSIYYARRIQTALLPNDRYIDKHLKKLTANN